MLPYFVAKLICYVAGYMYPAYASFKAVKSWNTPLLSAWLMYWIVMGIYTSIEFVSDTFFFWFPFYYDAKTLFILWMVLPQTQGSIYLYTNYVDPYLRDHEGEIDRTLQDTQERAKSMGLIYIKKAAQWIQKTVMDLVSKGQLGSLAAPSQGETGIASVSSAASSTTTAPTSSTLSTTSTAPTLPPRISTKPPSEGYLSWAYNVVSPKLASAARFGAQSVANRLPAARPLPQPPVNLYPGINGNNNHGATQSSTSSSTPASSANGFPKANGVVNPENSLGISSLTEEAQKRLEALTQRLDRSLGGSSTLSSYSSAISEKDGNNLTMRKYSLYADAVEVTE